MAKRAKAPAKAIGRPSKRSPAIIDRIVEGLSAGTPLTVLCAPDDMPADRTVRDWMDADAALSAAIARARETGFDAIAAGIIPIVDDLTEEPASRRVRAETRLKLLAKWDPKRYGDRVDHTSSDGSMTPAQTLVEFYGKAGG